VVVEVEVPVEPDPVFIPVDVFRDSSDSSASILFSSSPSFARQLQSQTGEKSFVFTMVSLADSKAASRSVFETNLAESVFFSD
jgi:hypothetical protein